MLCEVWYNNIDKLLGGMRYMMINVECATKKDYPQFKDVHNRFSYVGSTELREPVVDEQRFLEYVENGSMFVGFEGDTIVGYAIVSGYDDGTCDINEIFVLPEHQHKGYGKQIVQKIEKVAKESGFTQLRVFSIFIETDCFWMRKCCFRAEESGYLVKNLGKIN